MNKLKQFKSKFVFLGILIAIVLSLSLAFASITYVTLVSPANNVWTNSIAPDFTFRAGSDIVSAFSCRLIINSVTYATNNSVQAGVDTIMTPMLPLNQGTHSWNINCSDDGWMTPGINSETRTINIDTGDPVVTLLDPQNGYETQSRSIDFEYMVTDNYDNSLQCYLYIDGVEEADMVAYNADTEIFSRDYLERGNHDWYVTCEDDAGNSGTSSTWGYTIEEIGYCNEGIVGSYFDVNIKEPDSGDDFYVGEEISVEVEVENDYTKDLDIVIKAQLYDMDDEDEITEERLEVEIQEDETETYTLKLRIPSTVDDNNDFVVQVKVYKDGDEDEQCNEDSVDVELNKKNHYVVIEEFSIYPTTASCGDSFNLNLKIENAGESDEDVQIKILNSDLSIDFEKTIDLDENDDYGFSQTFSIPKDIQEGNYDVKVIVSYNYYSTSYHDYVKDYLTLKVEGDCLPVPEYGLSFTLSQIGDVFIGSDFTTKVIVTNTGNTRTTYSVDVSGYEDWADLIRINPETITLDGNNLGYVYITLRPNQDALGLNSFKVKISYDNIVKEQDMTVDIKYQSEAASRWRQFVFEMKRNWYWVLLNIALLAIIVALIVYFVIHRKGRRKRTTRPTTEAIVVKPFQPEWNPQASKAKTRKITKRKTKTKKKKR